MHRLFLLRHAKSGWAAPGMTDFERPLTASGISDAEALGRHMRDSGLLPDLVLCSTARRARETLDRVLSVFGEMTPRIIHDEELYNSDAARYVEIIRQAPENAALLVVGHNPVMEDLAFALPGGGNADAMRLASSGFPTCGLAVLGFENPLSELKPGTGSLEAFLRPERV